jgi:gamma-glutamyltranspeptidase
LFLPNGAPITTGTKLYSSGVYRSMINQLRGIALAGAEVFYEGEMAESIVNETEGAITLEDLKAYEVVEREAIHTMIGSHRVRKECLQAIGKNN